MDRAGPGAPDAADAAGLLPPLGILGGTFDPIHLGHLAIAAAAREALDLAGVVLVPAAVPPHKRDREITPAARRVALVELAVAGDPTLAVSRIELERAGPSWAVDTVAAFAAAATAEGRAAPWFILSVEALAAFGTWREPERILDLCRIAAVPRPGAVAPTPAALAARFPGRDHRIMLLPGPTLAISATEVRARIAAGLSIRHLVPPAVAAAIARDGLGVPAGALRADAG
ncbi:MAG: nicotinate-nucleotide adenylyltransferase [Chloroflexota bacterium]